MLQVLIATDSPFLSVFCLCLCLHSHIPIHIHNTVAYARLALLTFMLYLMTSEIRGMCYLLELRNMFSNKNCVACIWSFKQIHVLYLLTCHRLKWCDSHFLAFSCSKKLVVFFMIVWRTFERCPLKIWSSFLTTVFKHERSSLGIKSLNPFLKFWK